jgi:hypothetical protein
VRLSIRGAEINDDDSRHSPPGNHGGGLANPAFSARNFQQGFQSSSSALLNVPKPRLADDATNLPRSDLLLALTELFFRHFGSIFPFADRNVVDIQGNLAREMLDPGMVMMINAMCALSAR